MKEYEKPIINDEIVEMPDVICVSSGEATSEGIKLDWSDIVNGK